jgi:hypothetical protein
MPKSWVIELLRALFFFLGTSSILIGALTFTTSKSAVHETVAALFLVGGGLLVVAGAILLSLERIERLLAKQLEVALLAQEQRDKTALGMSKGR